MQPSTHQQEELLMETISDLTGYLTSRREKIDKFLWKDLKPNTRKVRKDLKLIFRLARNQGDGIVDLRDLKVQEKVCLEELGRDGQEIRWCEHERGTINRLLSLLGDVAKGKPIYAAFHATGRYLRELKKRLSSSDECSRLIREVERCCPS